MGNILSQDEVDSLLGGITDGQVETETDVSEGIPSVEVYDFSMPAGPVHLRLPALGIINERLVGLLRTNLQVASRSVIDVNLASTDTVKFSDFCLSLPMPSSLNIFSIEPLRGFSLVVLEGPLVFSFVDSLFGGKGVSHVKLEGRLFTKIETKIVEKIVKIILNDFQKAWSDVYEINAVFIRSEMDPQFVGIGTPDDLVIVNKFEVQLENGNGFITICIPYSGIKPIKEKLKNKFRSEKIDIDQNWKRYIQERIQETMVELSCTMGMAKINGTDLLSMKVDDVIMLDQKSGNSVIINVENIPKFRGYPGACNKKKAVKIIDRLE
ncbi:MAG: flagellar motor switch protein FliM [Desulfobacteraceae bacterium]|jgi:flagellar motor switch protein FliM|nr:flagellar motor switch protein FliM [Desulfobacteraceae bacterium]MDH3573068.1 flagellar motor switch protein FliM [Desulfobacteraceae bacterium]MDH3720098.1 flagellar motor switch protein FliM [Desulfobacteraceae bacterium]MDH3836162.1 flagellar motor switch protein FliM [Desulfobacteraceae bacterium]MDH3873897.1 flagellar motor switch protein FliM [Desulfobacteraceae bacterium]